MNILKVNDWRDIPKNYTGIAEYHNGDKEFYFNGLCHRVDGPAVEFVNGDKFWYNNNELHREGGPAIKCMNGDKEWYLNGQRHRLDGPAIEFANGYKSWYLNGFNYSQEEWFELLNDEDKEKAIWNLR
jgi:hypothetical protein